MSKNLLFTLLTVTLFYFGNAQNTLDRNTDETALSYAKASFTELKTFFSLPNDSNYPDQLEKNLKWCESAFANLPANTLV